jgi:glycosyltransferase involved in cell wall biosynthesis
VPPGEPDVLADALRSVLDGDAPVGEMVASGECRAAHFSMEHLAERYLDLYGRLVA